VGVALWPGNVEDAFRRLAASVAEGTFDRNGMIGLFAQYGVIWNAPASDERVEAEVRPFGDSLDDLPPALSGALRLCWGE
jgi:hypothetical protein